MKEIVFIDDEMYRMQYYAEFLELEEYSVKTFDDDEAAFAYIELNKHNIGLIILDLIMPSRQFGREDTNNYFNTGWHLLSKIRELINDVPVIVLTIKRDIEKAASKYKVNHILVKDDTTPDILLEKVEEILGRASSHME